ncbi:MAG: MATE family efflux transporter [Longimicrobiales bacterium]
MDTPPDLVFAAAAPHRPGTHTDLRVEIGALAALAGPIIFSQLGQVGMSTADTLMVGRLGATPLAAAGLGSALHFFGVLICAGILLGMAPLVSQAFGAGDINRCRAVLVQGVWVALLLAVPLTASCILGGPIARALGQEESVVALTGGYLRALGWGVPPLLLFMTFRQFLEAMGHVRATMIITFLGLATNIAFNFVLIFGAGGWIEPLGVVGAGLATSITRWAMLIATLVYIHIHPELRPFHGVRLRPHREMLRRIISIGLPAGGHFGLEVGLFSLAAVLMGWLGPLELAAHQVTINIASTTFMVALGVSFAGSIRVGQHVGAGRQAEMRNAVRATYLLATGFMAMCALLFVIIPHTLIGLYTDDPAIIALGGKLLLCAAAFQIFDGAQVAGTGVLRGAADTRVPMVLAALGYWAIGMPVGYTLAFHFHLGALGIWIGLSAGLALVAILLLIRARKVLWGSPIAVR